MPNTNTRCVTYTHTHRARARESRERERTSKRELKARASKTVIHTMQGFWQWERRAKRVNRMRNCRKSHCMCLTVVGYFFSLTLHFFSLSLWFSFSPHLLLIHSLCRSVFFYGLQFFLVAFIIQYLMNIVSKEPHVNDDRTT